MLARYTALVTNGDFAATEKQLLEVFQSGILKEYLSKFRYEPKWTLLKPIRDDGTFQDRSEIPGMRGGHQMCIDSKAGAVYLFGGWDGGKDLGDFWRYSIAENRWEQLSADTEADGGPDARSCHKVVLDVDKQVLYVFGK